MVPYLHLTFLHSSGVRCALFVGEAFYSPWKLPAPCMAVQNRLDKHPNFAAWPQWWSKGLSSNWQAVNRWLNYGLVSESQDVQAASDSYESCRLRFLRQGLVMSQECQILKKGEKIWLLKESCLSLWDVQYWLSIGVFLYIYKWYCQGCVELELRPYQGQTNKVPLLCHAFILFTIESKSQLGQFAQLTAQSTTILSWHRSLVLALECREHAVKHVQVVWHQDMCCLSCTSSSHGDSEFVLAQAGQHRGWRGWWEGRMETGRGHGEGDQTWMEVGTGLTDIGQILTPTPGPTSLIQAAQICTCKIAGEDPSSPI